MHLANFKVEDTASSIEVEGSHRDLHNNFLFYALDYDIANREIRLRWRLRDADWVAGDDPEYLDLIFQSVSLFKSKERDLDSPYSEDDCLSTIGFIGNDMIEDVESYSYTSPSNEASHLNISFMSGFAIKVASGSAKCIQGSSL
ncbi:hypothetical protein [Agaribacterium sp. ZY112]|uniref:hypothetical protein n=1 Tax=Agaribacterium sp. ZY112 TaxID=3233574 RepID=UPI003525B14B